MSGIIVTQIHYPPLPEGTARKARLLYGSDDTYLTIGDHLNELLKGLIPNGRLFLDEQVGGTYCLYLLITAFQYEEELPDLRLIECLPDRLDLKYALHLPVELIEINPLSLDEFRQHLLSEPSDINILQLLLDRLHARGFFSSTPGRVPEARAVLKTLLVASRLERVLDAMFLTLEKLAIEAPDWLREIARPHWYERYNRSHQKAIPIWPHLEGDWKSLPFEIGSDIFYLLDQIAKSPVGTVKALPEMMKLIDAWEDLSKVVLNESLQ